MQASTVAQQQQAGWIGSGERGNAGQASAAAQQQHALAGCPGIQAQITANRAPHLRGHRAAKRLALVIPCSRHAHGAAVEAAAQLPISGAAWLARVAA